MSTEMDVDEPQERWLDTVEGEIAFFRSVMRARPVGMHRQFHVLAIRNYIYRATDRWVAPEELWRKLKECYDLDMLEALVRLSPVHMNEHPQEV